MQLVAIVNSFNRRELLMRAVTALVRALDPSGVAYGIVVFEAGSTDGSREWLCQFAAEHPQLRLETILAAQTEDTSFAEGVNRACRHALQTFPEAEFLFLYETDNWIAGAEPITRAMQVLRDQPRLAALGFTVRLHSGTPCGWGTPFPTVLSFVLGQHLSGYLGIPKPRTPTAESRSRSWFPADVVYTSPLMIKAAVWRELGGMDSSRFPFSDSDVDWAWKAAKAGYRSGVLVSDAVVHDNGGAMSSWSNMRVLKFHQARFRLLRRYRGPVTVLAIPALFLRHAVEFGLLAAMVLAGRRPALSLRKRLLLMRSVWRGYEFV